MYSRRMNVEIIYLYVYFEGVDYKIKYLRLRPSAYRNHQSPLIPPWEGGRLQPERETTERI